MIKFISAAVISSALLLGATAANAQVELCAALYVKRNQIFKDAGLCFTRRTAIQYFGNAGCSYDNEAEVPLSSNQRAQVQEYVRQERLLGCPRLP